MPTAISPSTHLPAPQGAASGTRGRSDQPEGRSFGAALDRSRAAVACTPESVEASGPESATSRKPARTNDRKTELSADDVMALLAPLSAQIVPSAVQARLAPEQASKVSAASIDGPAVGTAAKPAADATAVADASARPVADQNAPKTVKDGSTRAAEPDANQDDNGGLQLAGADTAAPLPDASASTDQSVPASTAAQTAHTRACVAPKPASSSDTTTSATAVDKAATTAQADAIVGSANAQAPASHADAAPIEPASDPVPQALQTVQASAGAETARTAEPARPAHAATVAPEVGSSEWGPAIGRHMIRMGANGQQVAELNLNPANLGPLKVTLTLGDNQAQAMFVSAHEAVRKAVEAALPQLRTTLAEQGINLGQTSVGAETRQPNSGGNAFAEQNPQRPQGRPEYPGAGRTDATVSVQAMAPSAPMPRRAAGLDTFA